MHYQTVFNIIEKISVFISVIPMLLLFRKAFNPQLKALLIYLLLSFATEMASWYCGIYSPKSNFLLINIYSMFEFLIILYIYYKEFHFKKQYPLYVICLLFIFLSLINISLTHHDAIAYAIDAALIASFSVFYFFRLSNDITIPKLTNFYFFWINSAFLFYFSTSFFVFLFMHNVNTLGHTISLFLWSIHMLANISYNVLFIIGIFKIKKKSPDLAKTLAV